MSLRDQLLKAGLVSKKKHAKVNRDKKAQRRTKQSRKEKRTIIEAREVQEKQHQKAAREDTQRKRRRESDAREAARHKAQAEARAEKARLEAIDAKKRHIDQLLTSSQIRHKEGQQLFYFTGPGGIKIRRMRLPESLAEDLRQGSLAIVWRGERDAEVLDILVIPHKIAERIAALDPSRVLFLNSTPPEPSDHSEKLL